MMPFALFLVRNSASNKDITDSRYGHLCIAGKLPFYPNIMLTTKDFVPHTKKTKKFRIFLAPSQEVKRIRLDALQIKVVILLDSQSEEPAFQKYVTENLDGLQVYDLTKQL